MNFGDDLATIPIDNSENHYVLMFDLTPMQDATENSHYPELVGESMTLELNFSFPLEHFSELVVLGERMYRVAVDKFCVVGKNLKWIVFFSSKEPTVSHNSIIGTVVLLPWLCSTLDNDTFANTK